MSDPKIHTQNTARRLAEAIMVSLLVESAKDPRVTSLPENEREAALYEVLTDISDGLGEYLAEIQRTPASIVEVCARAGLIFDAEQEATDVG